MEEILSHANSVPTLLAAICVIGTLHLVFKLAEFTWKMIEKRSEISESTMKSLVSSVQRLDSTIRQIEKDLTDIPKFKKDIERCFRAMKLLAGDKWPEIRRSLSEEDV